jgi:hypothetical protein
VPTSKRSESPVRHHHPAKPHQKADAYGIKEPSLTSAAIEKWMFAIRCCCRKVVFVHIPEHVDKRLSGVGSIVAV